MRLAIVMLVVNIAIIIMTTYVGISVVINGPLNARTFFVDDVRNEFTDWSKRLAKYGNRTYVNKQSCPKDLQQFLEKYGVISVTVSSNGDTVDWLLYGRARVRIHYGCSLFKDGGENKGGDCSWVFSLEGESVSPEALLNILAARRYACKKWIVWLCLVLCTVLISNKFYFFDDVWQKIPALWRALTISVVWVVNMLLFCVMVMNLWITCYVL